MSYLWDLSHIRPETRVVMEGDTIPAVFWNAVKARGPNVWMRQKDFGIWRSWTWAQSRSRRQRLQQRVWLLVPGWPASLCVIKRLASATGC